MVSSRKALFFCISFSLHLSLTLRSLDRLGLSDVGCTVDEILAELQSQGYSFTGFEVMPAVNSLLLEGHIYSTIDEAHFQLAE